MKKIAIIAPVHHAADIRVVKKECQSALNAQYKVYLIARGRLDSTIEGKVTYHKVSYQSRLQRFLLFPKVLQLALTINADVYHIHNPDTIFLGLFLKLTGRKVIYDTHESFVDKVYLREWVPSVLRPILAVGVDLLERFSSIFFDATIVTQERQLKKFHTSYLIGNAPVFRKITASSHNAKREIQLVYVGGISEDRGLSYMLSLTKYMNEIHPTKLILIGPLVNNENDSLIHDAISGSSLVSYLGPLKQSMAFEYIQSSDFGLALFKSVADYEFTDPNKIYEYMMLRTLYIANDFNIWKERLDTVTKGIFVSESQINRRLAEQVVALYFDKKKYNSAVEHNYNYIRDTYNWRISEEPKLIKIYNKVLSQ